MTREYRRLVSFAWPPAAPDPDAPPGSRGIE